MKLRNVNQFEFIVTERTANNVLVIILCPSSKLHAKTLCLSVALNYRAAENYLKKVHYLLRNGSTTSGYKSHSSTKRFSDILKENVIKYVPVLSVEFEVLKLACYCILNNEFFHTAQLLHLVLNSICQSVQYSRNREQNCWF